MTKQVLDVQQMQHLQELGLDTSNASALYCIDNESGEKQLMWNEQVEETDKDDEYFRIVPAYTLQDVLDALPKMIYPFPVHKIGFELWIGSGKIFYANMFNLEDVLKVRYDKELIDAAYSMLCWAIENGYIETNKTNEV